MDEQNRKRVHRPMGGEIQPPVPGSQEYIAEHTVTDDDTLSHIALKYYGSAIKDKWMPIYEANKAVIGADPGKLRPGIVLKIPKLAD